MTIALQVSGQLRQFNNLYNIYRQNLLECVDNDLILYTWTSDTPVKIQNDGTAAEYVALYKPYQHVIEQADQAFFKRSGLGKAVTKIRNAKHFAESYISSKSIIYQSYQRYMCNRLKIKQYDVCVVTRPDAIFAEPFPVSILEEAKESLLIPIGSDWEYGICDLFAIGPQKYIDIYCDLYFNLYKYAHIGVMFHPEHLLKYHLDKHNVPIKRFSYTIHLNARRMT